MQGEMGSEYERVRAARIEENKKKLEELGINVVKTAIGKPSRKKKQVTSSSTHQRRASPRLSIVKNPDHVQIENESPLEVYTEKDDKLLGDCKNPWPFLDDENDKRLYDPINGITCHQCRQKTLGSRTHCNLCHSSNGRLCGICLYKRYGENLFEAKQNATWSCPMCRGICNCSRCRRQKGLPPTGSIHAMAWELGFKSVAHYLIKTHRG